MLDETFLKGLFEKKDVADADKIKSILAEAEAGTRGLIQKRDELLASERSLKDKIAVFETGKKETDTKIASLEEELKKASSDDHKKYYETQLADLQKKQADELAKLTQDRDFYKASHLKFLQDKEINESLKDLHFIDGLKEGFIARVMGLNNFQGKDIDGSIKFLNKDNHTIKEAIDAFALTQEGKAYLQNQATGGGATGGGAFDAKSKTATSDQISNMSDEQLMAFAIGGGSVIQ